MDSLPPEIFSYLINFLTFNEKVKVMQVSSKFKNAVELSLRKILQVKIEYSTFNRRSEYALYFASIFPVTKRSIIFFENNMEKVSLIEEKSESFFKFISKFCPAIEVIDAPLFEINYETLKLIGQNLRYFSFHDIKFNKSNIRVNDLPSIFPLLEAFDIFSLQRSHRRLKKPQIPFDHKEFFKHKLNYPKPFLQWVKCSLDEKKSTEGPNSNIPQNVKSLAIHGSFFKLEDVEMNLANSLEYLNCRVDPLLFTVELPNLKSAAIESSVNDASFIVDFLTPSTKLEKLTLKLHPNKSISNFFHLFNFPNLKYLQLHLTLDFDHQEQLVFPLPPKLVELDFTFFKKQTIIFSESSSLKYLTMNKLPDDSTFNFPSLTKFSLKQLTKRNMESLLTSLKNSKSLKHLFIGTSYHEVIVKPPFVQNFLNFLPLIRLTSLYISLKLPFNTSKVFILRKSDVPDLREDMLEWKVINSKLKLID